MTRCHECDRPVATQGDHDRCPSDCLCERCTQLCWVNWGYCTGKKIDWRARALKAEELLGDRATAPNVDLDQLERVARAARPGPWQWYGNTKMNEVYLSTIHGGRVFVMDFVRWGMGGAQPRFQVDELMVTLGDLGKAEHPMGPKFEASHRRQFVGIGHPDAEHIAANSPDVTLALIGRIRELEAKLAGDPK